MGFMEVLLSLMLLALKYVVTAHSSLPLILTTCRAPLFIHGLALLSPELPIAALLSTCDRTLLQVLSALLLKILHLNLLNPELIEVPCRVVTVVNKYVRLFCYLSQEASLGAQTFNSYERF